MTRQVYKSTYFKTKIKMFHAFILLADLYSRNLNNMVHQCIIIMKCTHFVLIMEFEALLWKIDAMET